MKEEPAEIKLLVHNTKNQKKIPQIYLVLC